MAEKVQMQDFVEVNYTGKLLDGMIFDTTEEKVAKDNNLYSEKMNYSPAAICVGEKQILSGLDDQLIDKEVGKSYTVTLSPENAFGKRDVKKVKIVPIGTFKEHNVQPQPGLQIDVDGEMGTVSKVSGGRVIVNFNHPLSGKEVVYEFIIRRKITDQNEQIVAFLNTTLKVPKNQINVEIKEEKAVVEMPMALPPQFADALGKKLADLVKLKRIGFKGKEVKKE